MITNEQKEKYIATGGLMCPYCGGLNMEITNTSHQIGVIINDIKCEECEGEWTEEMETRIVDVFKYK